MATVNWSCTKDARIAVGGGNNMGAGASDYLPVGTYSGYKYRSLLAFGYSFAGMTSISSAILHIKTSSQYYVAFGASPQSRIDLITSSWSEGTSVGLSTTNSVVYPGPSASGTNAVTLSPGTVENTWKTADVTAMVNSVFGGTFYGLRMYAWDGSGESASANDVSEYYAREYGSNDAYITVTYSTNTAPTAPTLSLPANAAVAQSLTPSIKFLHNDPQADAILNYDLQVSTDSTFASVTHWNIAAQTTGNNVPSAGYVTRTYAGTALANNTTYYWRARTKDPGGLQGPWSAAFSFKTLALPVAALTEPTADATRLAKLSYTAGAGWASPRLNATWTFTCADGGTQASYQVFIESATTSAGTYTTWHDTGTVVSTSARSIVDATTVVEGNYYKVKVRVTCSHGAVSAYTATVRARARWGVSLHRFDCTTAPVSWSISSLNITTAAASAVVMEYGSNSTTTTPTMYASLASATLNRYFFYRAWIISTGGASPVTSASLDKLVLTYSQNVMVPDKWTRSDTVRQTVDTSTYVYGTQSLRLAALTGNSHAAYQLIQVTPDTDYVMSFRGKTIGNAQALCGFSVFGTSGAIIYMFIPADTTEWTRFTTGIWNSGANTEIYISVRSNAGTTGAYAWFDAIKVEAARVATPWSPSFLGAGVVLDAGGLQIDGSNGGIFRLQGSGGGTRDRVDLGVNGLDFGGDTEVYSPVAGRLDLSATNPGISLNSGAGDYAYIRTQNSAGAARFLFDYGTGTSDDVRLGLYSGAAGSETYQERIRLVASANQINITVGDIEVTGTTAGINNPIIRLLSGATPGATDYTAFAVNRSGDSAARAMFGYMGDLQNVGIAFGPGNAARDTNLYRSAANLLKTDDSLEVAGQFICGEQAIKVKAGIPSDTDFGVDVSGNICLDTTNGRIYFRVGTTWKYAALV